MAFNGKLLEIKVENSYTEFPMKLINAESYKVTPNQRMEASANRSTTGLLKRTTCSHTASKIDLSTIVMSNTDVSVIEGLLTSAYTNAQERKLDIRYYVPSSDSYKTATVYVPDVDYNIMRVDLTTNKVWYNSVRYAFIEY